MREKLLSCVTENFKLCERKNLSCMRKRELRFCNLNHLGNLVFAILGNLVDLLNWVLAILVHFAPFWLTGFILVDFVPLGSCYFGSFCSILVHFAPLWLTGFILVDFG